MGNLATVNVPGVSGTSRESGSRQESGPAQNPFGRAAILHREAAGYDELRPMNASVQNLPDVVVPAYGYLRYIKIVVEGTGATGGTPVFNEDAAGSVIQDIVLQEPNGAQIISVPSAWWLMVPIQKYSGFRYATDPRTSHTYGVTATGNFKFTFTLPLEIGQRDGGLASLPNQNSAAAFRCRMNLAPASTVYATPPTTLPTVRVRAYMGSWDQPEDVADNMQNATTPPSLNSTSFITVTQFPINQGNQSIRLSRVGNFLRTLNFVFKAKDTTDLTKPATRRLGDAAFPKTAEILYDTRPQDVISREEWLDQIQDRYHTKSNIGTTVIAPDQPYGRDYGVFPYDFAHEFDGKVGAELRDNLQRTLSSTRLEIRGQWDAPGTLYVATNDVVPVGNIWS